DLARAGQEVELAARPVTIERVELMGYAWPRLELEVDCGAGTYIRSIARDVGEALGCGGLVEVLVRTRIGPFTLAAAMRPPAVAPDAWFPALRPAVGAVAGLPRLVLSADEVARVVRGQPLDARQGAEAGEFALIGPGGALVAVAEADPRTGRIC